MPRLLQVFEHEMLRYPSEREGVSFLEKDFQALVRFNEERQGKYFTVGHRGIRFAQYVGVLRVGDLTLEILPKADADPPTAENKRRWQGVLLDMLRECRLLKLETGLMAPLQVSQHPILDVYLQAFVAEVERLVGQGLVKRYRSSESNLGTLKGSLYFPRHVQENAVHQEQFYVRHQTYDTRHPIHQLLSQALGLFPGLTHSQPLLDWAQRVKMAFPVLPELPLTQRVFDKLVIQRAMQPYQYALQLARLVLLGYQPDIRGGSQHTLSLLFDMNALFEEYVFRQLKKAETASIRIHRQQANPFWMERNIRPDIVIRRLQPDSTSINYVVDTKWKVLRRPQPDVEDLKQMYIYNQHYRANRSILLYPDVYGLGNFRGFFHLPNPFVATSSPSKTPLEHNAGSSEKATFSSHSRSQERRSEHSCEIQFLRILENGKLRHQAGVPLLRQILADSSPAS